MDLAQKPQREHAGDCGRHYCQATQKQLEFTRSLKGSAPSIGNVVEIRLPQLSIAKGSDLLLSLPFPYVQFVTATSSDLSGLQKLNALTAEPAHSVTIRHA